MTDRCHQIDDEVWAAYSARLDRGLDELQVEMARAADHPDSGPSVDDVVFVRTARLQLDGVLVRLDVPGAAPDQARVRKLAARNQRTRGSGLEQAMAELRRAAR
ncbi:hypothetical protein [Pseudonocardia adelaidensis]|uniref:hypothetical protein n=1 Tax=Pseudonocardia adelaidensis TaxID=648754 RepID=UPI003CD083E8